MLEVLQATFPTRRRAALLKHRRRATVATAVSGGSVPSVDHDLEDSAIPIRRISYPDAWRPLPTSRHRQQLQRQQARLPRLYFVHGSSMLAPDLQVQ
jgi:hypothetical protein